MKKQQPKDYTLLLIGIILLIAILASCNGRYSDMGGDGGQVEDKPATKLRDYQIELHQNSAVIYDGDRVVGVLSYDSTSAFDNIITNDNL